MLKKFKENRVQVEQQQNKETEVIGKAAEKRMKHDIQKYNEDKIDNVVISFPVEGCVTELIIKLYPKEGSFYRNSQICFSFKAGEEYPIKPPEVKCLNKILHPNIDKNGNVCLSLLRAGWKAVYELFQIVVGLLHLMQNIKAADIQEPLDNDAAELMNKDINEFDKVVQQTIKGKSYFGRQFDNVSYTKKK